MMDPETLPMVQPHGETYMQRLMTLLRASGLVLALAISSWGQAAKMLPTQTITIAGIVETIDHAKCVVTIRTDAGALVTVDVPEGATRFNELKVGDKVKATYNNTVIVILKPPGEPPVDTSLTLRAGGEGERPGGAMGMERWMTVTVDAIDPRTSSITFVGPNGWKYSRRVTDPTVLDRLKVGDNIDVMWNTDVTVAVE
jgi:Cu/Ag efflux protein CusF